MTLRLDLGSGGCVLQGWEHVDRAFTPETYEAAADVSLLVQYDLTEIPWPWKANSVDMACAHHFLDLLSAEDCERVLAETHRALKPGGWFRVSLFDILKATAARDRRDYAWFTARDANVANGIDAALECMVHLNGARKWVTTPEMFGPLLIEAGFEDWREAEFEETACPRMSILELDSREHESMFVEARKAKA